MRTQSLIKIAIILSVIISCVLAGWPVMYPLKFIVLGGILGFLAFRAWPTR